MAMEALTAGQIAEMVGGTVEGDPDVRLTFVAALDAAGKTDLTFVSDARRAGQLSDSQAGAALVAQDVETARTSMTLIRVARVEVALAAVLDHWSPPPDLPALGIAETAVVSSEAHLGDGVRVGPGVVIASGAKIGDGATLCANVSVGSNVEIGADSLLCEGVSVRRDCLIGRGVMIGPNSVIGHDGFGYYHADGVHHKVAHIGNVVIEDDVEIGACTCVDRAKFGSTRIGAGTKIDNQVQIAHNTKIGRGCILAGKVGIAGSVKMGDYVVLGGGAGVFDNISIGAGVQAGARTLIMSDVPDGQKMFGHPATEAREAMRLISLTRKLPELYKRVQEMTRRLEAIESSKDN